MKAHDFVGLVDDVLDTLKADYYKKAFVENMEKLPHLFSDKKFSEWMMLYLAWSELGSADDVARHFWHLEDESDTVSDEK